MATTLAEIAQERKQSHQDRIAILAAKRGQPADPAPAGSVLEMDENLAAAREDLRKRASELDVVIAKIQGIREALAAPDVSPAEVGVLGSDLRDEIMERRLATGRLLAAEEAVHDAASMLSQGTTELQRAKARLAEAETLEKETEARDTQLHKDLEALELKDIKAQATAALSVAPHTDAAARVEGDIPVELRERAVARGLRQRSRESANTSLLAGADDVLALRLEKDAGVSVVESRTRSSLARAEAAFKAMFIGEERLQGALARCRAIHASPELDSAQRTRITSGSVYTNGKAAAALEKARDDAQADHEDATRELELLQLTIDTQEGAATPDQTQRKTDLEAVQTNAAQVLQGAEAAFDEAEQGRLEKWETAVPDEVWNNLIALEKATATLEELRDGKTPAARLQDVRDAEQTLVTLLIELDDREAKRERLEDELSRARKQGEFLAGTAERRLLSAVRGDQR